MCLVAIRRPAQITDNLRGSQCCPRSLPANPLADAGWLARLIESDSNRPPY
jgi:hypothetical protein